MFKTFFNIIINMLATVIQVVVWPLNTIIANAFPDFSSKILEITDVFGNVFSNMYWAIGVVPPIILGTLGFILTCEIAKHSVYILGHVFVKVWHVIQNIKFW